MVSIRSLRTQQRAKSQCIKHIPPSMGWSSLWRPNITEICQDHSAFWWGALWNGLHSAGFCPRFVYMHSTESLILAQDERWRRA